jgi:hypothetical protein
MSHIRTFRTLTGDVCCSGPHWCDACRTLSGRYEDPDTMPSAPEWTATLSAPVSARVWVHPGCKDHGVTFFSP